jgi:hypothetical protein
MTARSKLKAGVFIVCGVALAQTPPEPGVSPGVEVQEISHNEPQYSSAFPFVSAAGGKVLIGWRIYSLPIDTNASKESRTADCYVSLSLDGGKTFQTTSLMSALRTTKTATQPELWYCNAPWTAIGPEGTLYAGGALFTANGVVGTEPKQGRQMVTVSRDSGKTWGKGLAGLETSRFGEGVAGIEGGREPQDTPWDGAKGFVDWASGNMYSTAQGYAAASKDKGKSFGIVNRVAASKEWPGRGGDFAASHGALAAAYFANAVPVSGKSCPCLVFAVSDDDGGHFARVLVADAKEVSANGRPRYPQIAADPAHAGHFAVLAYTPDHRAIKVFFTEDSGKTWRSATPQAVPANVLPVTSADMPGLAYTADGRILAAWRGFRNAGAYNAFAALMENGKFGPTIKITPEASPYPPLVQMGNYSFGGGDFTTCIAGDDRYAHVVFPYSPGGIVQRTWYARVPLTAMR